MSFIPSIRGAPYASVPFEKTLTDCTSPVRLITIR